MGKFKTHQPAMLVQPRAIEKTLAIKCKGPYKMVKQHKNGSITIQVAPYETKMLINADSNRNIG